MVVPNNSINNLYKGRAISFYRGFVPIPIFYVHLLNLVKAQLLLGECRKFSSFVENCLATIGVCVFRCVNFGWRTFLFYSIF